MAFAVNAVAQEEYPDLLNLLIDEDYEKLCYKAEKYTLDDDTKKDPMPWLYMSMGFYEISKISDFDEDYPKAFKDALKYAGKYRKKDKDGQYFDDNQDFFDLLRETAIIEAETFNDQEKYAKSKGYYKYLYSIDENDAGAWVYTGIVLQKLKAAKESQTAFETAKSIISNGCDDLTKIQMDYLRSGLIYMADIYSDEGRGSEAKEWMELAMPYFEDNKEYKVTYNNL